MEAIAIQEKQATHTPIATSANKEGRLISWLEFERKYLPREDSFKYEWVNGRVVKTKRTMDFKQIFIFTNLNELFRQLKNMGRVNGDLISEVDTFFANNHRRPDLAWFSKLQISAGKNGVAPVPEFVIEVISTNDQMNTVEDKMEDYIAAGVKVVWQIFPKFEKVKVFGGSRLNDIKELRGEEICSAAPVLPDFEMSVRDVFKG